MVKFTMRGSDVSLQKGLDTIKAALAQAGFAAIAPETRATRPSAPQLTSAPDREDSENVEELVDEATEAEVVSATPSTRRASPARKPANYKIMKELTFTDVEPTLADFCSDKEPSTDLDKYRCIAFWFKHHKDTPDLTVPHFFTAYLFLGWKTPPNPGQPVNDLRRKQHFSQGETHGTSSINNVGERLVHELKKAGA